MKYLPIYFIIIAFTSCNSQIKKDVTLTIVNKSDIKIDSVHVFDVFKKLHVIKEINPHSEIVKTFNYKNRRYPNNDSSAFELFMFLGSEFYFIENGIIDSPYALLNDSYKFYMHKEGVTLADSVLKGQYFRKPQDIDNLNNSVYKYLKSLNKQNKN